MNFFFLGGGGGGGGGGGVAGALFSYRFFPLFLFVSLSSFSRVFIAHFSQISVLALLVH